MDIRIHASDRGKYADAVGDTNPIHRFNAMAQNYGLREKIAPGMYIAFFI